MNPIRLDEAAVREVHPTLAGQQTSLAQALARARQEGAEQPASWSVPVTSANVHAIESLLLFAEDNNIAVEIDVADELSERERAFFDDVIDHRNPRQQSYREKLFAKFKELWAFAGNCLKVLVRMLPAAVAGKPKYSGEKLARVVLVGVYGGEHVGDIAILGGVLFRLHRQFGVEQARLFSHQPDYTRRLVACLDTPVTLEVLPDQPEYLQRALADTDALFWAGGPLMDLPPVLVKQLAAIYTMHRRQRPFFLEGVGVGPFRRAPSRWVARRIALAASGIAVRTRGAAADPIVSDMDVKIGRDPAFDYLETRQKLDRLGSQEAASVDRILDRTENTLRIGINIRPIRHFWSRRGEAWSIEVEENFMQNLAAAMQRFARQSERPVSYIFFPMNLIQIGYSDIAAAYRLQKLVAGAVDLHVWEEDPDVDGVLYLLRKLDMAITMRFHASIFSLSQGVPTIGVDYYPGEGGKVEQLFHDRGLHDDVRRMDEVEKDWLFERLTEHSASITPGAVG